MPMVAGGETRSVEWVRRQACRQLWHEQVGPSATSGQKRDPPISRTMVATIFAGRRYDILLPPFALVRKPNVRVSDFLLVTYNLSPANRDFEFKSGWVRPNVGYKRDSGFGLRAVL
jgi:hypothetical protein